MLPEYESVSPYSGVVIFWCPEDACFHALGGHTPTNKIHDGSRFEHGRMESPLPIAQGDPVPYQRMY